MSSPSKALAVCPLSIATDVVNFLFWDIRVRHTNHCHHRVFAPKKQDKQWAGPLNSSCKYFRRARLVPGQLLTAGPISSLFRQYLIFVATGERGLFSSVLLLNRFQ